jgi:hypothetical protein
MRPRLFDAYDEELEAPAFDGKPFTIKEPADDYMSRSAGWGLVLTILLTVVAIYSLRTGLVVSAAVVFVLASGIFALSCISIRKALREYMEYRHRRT